MTAAQELRARQVLDAIDARTLAESALVWQDHAAMSAALRAVLDRHRKATLYPADEDGNVHTDQPPLMDYCEECTPADTTEAIDDACWDDGMETVTFPCPTVRAVESAFAGAL